jgi:hypothetical protein
MDKMKNRESFSRYIYDLHELINSILNKKSNFKIYTEMSTCRAAVFIEIIKTSLCQKDL